MQIHTKTRMNFFSKLILKTLKNRNLGILKNHSGSETGNNLRFGDFCNFTLYPKLRKIRFGNDINIRNYCNIIVGNDAELFLGNRFFMNNYCSINCLEKIEIGENTLFGEGVKLYDHNHEYSSEPEFKVEHQKFRTAPVKIGKNCWLGSNVTVLKGVTIGDNTIIGAGCLVYKDVPANSVVKNKTENFIEIHKR